MANKVLTTSDAVNTTNAALPESYLCMVARVKAEMDAGVQTVALDALDQLVHFLFNYIFFIFYPAYDSFYYERQVEAFAAAGKELPIYESSGFREAVLFIHRFISTPSVIGSIFPSSKGLAHAITRKIADAAKNPEPQRYLEIGAGTGAFTEEIIRQMKPTDHLDIVEYDADLCRYLRRKFHHLKNVTIYNVSIFDYNAFPYDVLVSGLPLNAFPEEGVKLAHDKYLQLTKPGGFFSYFEYIGGATIKKAITCGDAHEEFSRVVALKRGLVHNYGKEIDEIWLNMTPARAVHCQMHKSSLGYW